MTKLTLESLREKLGDPEWAAVRITAAYQPSGGVGSRVFPPTFPQRQGESSPYLVESRNRDGVERSVVVLDQVPSQANRCEEALVAAWRRGGVPMPMLHLTHDGAAHFELYGLEAPHRAFDAYWRDSLLDGEKFEQTSIGRALQASSLADAIALLQYDPGTLVYGAWNSYRKGRQAKFPRIYSSEVIGWSPLEGVRKAGRMDPANLTGSRTGERDNWTYSSAAAKGDKSKLSEIGHGNIIKSRPSHGGVNVTEITRSAFLSLTAVRRIAFGALGVDAQQAAHAVLVALALLGDRLAFGNAGMWLRSGCDLVQESEAVEWIGRGWAVEEFSLSASDALALYSEAFEAARAVGLPLDPVIIELTPSKALAEAIDFSLTKAESTGE